jgi:D-erythro-7,8-dihydroneopterin triphosphate epimerase
MALAHKSSHENGSYTLHNAIIRVSNLRLRTYIGFNPDEIEKKQDIIINATIRYDAIAASQSDNKQDALNYKTITKRVIEHVEGNSFHLLEKLSSDLLKIAMENPEVQEASFTVDKPNALRFADSVSLTLSATRT